MNTAGCAVIAIDGPSASGKSTVSRQVAKALGWVYVNSGAIYRGLTWQMLRQGVEVRDAAAVAQALKEITVDFFLDADRAVQFRVKGECPNNALWEKAVHESVSFVAAVPAVREKVVAWLREMRRFGNLVMEGRDIGTVVFPEARCKIFLDASPQERARRRQRELGEADVSAVRTSLQRRDERDQQRAVAPLQPAADACLVDTSQMSISEVVERVLRLARGKLANA